MKYKIFLTLMIMAIISLPKIAIAESGAPVFEGGLKAPYAGFLFDGAPVIERVTSTPTVPVTGQRVKVSAVIKADPMRASLPVKNAELVFKISDGEWTTLDMTRGDGDPDYYFAYIPAVSAGTKVAYYVRAYDMAGSITSELPSGENWATVTDRDDDDDVVLKDIDIMKLEVSYDEKYFYVNMEVDGKPGKGNPTTGTYIYLMPVIDVKSGQGAADLLTVPILAYAPILSSFLGVDPAGLFRFSELLEKKSAIDGSDVKLKKDEHSLKFRVNLDSVTKERGGTIGIIALTLAATNMDNMLPWEASPYINLMMKSHEYTVAAEPQVVSFRAGAAQRDITPPIGTPLCGYGGRGGKASTGVTDPLVAAALVLEAGDEKYAIIGADFMYIRRKMFNDIGKAIEEKTGIPRDHMLLSGSHSHSSSGGMFPELAILGGKVSPGLYEATVEKFVEAVVEANGKLQPAKIGTASLIAEGMNNNRREDGGPVDQALGVMKVDSLKGDTIAVYYNFSAHPTVMGESNLSFNPEYPGAVRKLVAEKLNGAIAVFANGSLGNMSPGCVGDCGGGQDKINRMGEIFTDLIIKASKTMEMKEKAPFSFVSQEVLMHRDFGMWTNMSGMRIDDAVFVTTPGEIYVEIGFPVRDRAKELGFGSTFILGITNDGIGYIIPEEWYNKHVYEATFALYGPKEGEFVQNMMIDIIEQLSGKM